MKGFTRLVCIAVLCSCTMFSLAQQGDTLEIQHNQRGRISFARFKPDINRKMGDAVAFLKAVLQAKAEDEFRLVKDTIDGLGIAHHRYQQYYKGIKVEDAEYLIHGKHGVIESINGDFQDVNLPTVIPSNTEQQALSKALAYVSAKKYKWEDPEVEKFIKQRTSNPNASYYPKGELVITRDYLKGGNNSRLAWKFSISSLVPNNEQWIYVDAQTGEIIRKTPRIYDANIPCTAETLYSGTLSITGDSFTGGYRLRENRNGVNVLTLNLQHTYDFANAIDLVNSNTNFTSSGWPSFSVDRPALDAHLGAESVLDYWRTVHGRNSIDGNGMAVNSGVHFGSGVANAFWDDNANVMYYGDGDGILFKPLTTLDVCGHEIGHGITQYTSNLQYIFSQESSALNEGFSDIWGACVEHVAAPNKQMWLLGEEIFISTYNAIRTYKTLVHPIYMRGRILILTKEIIGISTMIILVNLTTTQLF